MLVVDSLDTCSAIYILNFEASVCVCHGSQRALTIYTQQQTALLRPIYPVSAVIGVKPLMVGRRPTVSRYQFTATGRGSGVGLWTLTRTPSLCLQLHYSCRLRVRRRELRRCITFGNYHVKPQSRKARLWLVNIHLYDSTTFY